MFIRVPFVFTCVHSCSLMFTRVHSCSIRVPLMFTRVHSCLFVFHSCSFVFTRVHSCSLVFIRVHSCSFVFRSVWCFRYDRLCALCASENQASLTTVSFGVSLQRATLFGQLKIGQLSFGQLNFTSYFMQIKLDLEGLKI